MNKEVKNIRNKGNNINKNGLKLKDTSDVVSHGLNNDDGNYDNEEEEKEDAGHSDDQEAQGSVEAGEIEDLSDIEMPTACPKGELSDLLRKEFEDNTSEMDSRYIRYTITPVMGKFIPPLNFEVSCIY